MWIELRFLEGPCAVSADAGLRLGRQHNVGRFHALWAGDLV
jgi:hypothetical protein